MTFISTHVTLSRIDVFDTFPPPFLQGSQLLRLSVRSKGVEKQRPFLTGTTLLTMDAKGLLEKRAPAPFLPLLANRKYKKFT